MWAVTHCHWDRVLGQGSRRGVLLHNLSNFVVAIFDNGNFGANISELHGEWGGSGGGLKPQSV